jgi:hypothetical protein
MTENTRIALESYVNARRALLDAMLADHRGGTSANDIARAAAAAWSRPVTLDYLSAWDRHARARDALAAAGLDGYVDVRTTGDTAGPRRVRLQIACDPADMEPDTWRALPDRIVAALMGAGVGWTSPGAGAASLGAVLGEVDDVELFDL